MNTRWRLAASSECCAVFTPLPVHPVDHAARGWNRRGDA